MLLKGLCLKDLGYQQDLFSAGVRDSCAILGVISLNPGQQELVEGTAGFGRSTGGVRSKNHALTYYRLHCALMHS